MPAIPASGFRGTARGRPACSALLAYLAPVCFAPLVLTASGQGASAQFAYGYGYARPLPGPFYEEDVLVPPRAVVYRLQDRGFTEIARPRFDGTAYVVEATDPAGARVRLFIDGRSGGLIGRRRLDVPYYPAARAARTAPSYGWTDEDAERGSGGRLVPPADIPQARPRPDRERTALAPSGPVEGRPGSAGRPAATPRGGDANPLGVNPDARNAGDPAPRATPPRRTAKLIPPKATPPAVAPEPAVTPSGSTDAAAKPSSGVPASAATTTSTPAAGTPAPSAPAAATAGPSEAAKPEAKRQEAKAPEFKAPETKAQTWQDPPSDGGRRPVRVIGGATVVPGTEAPAAAGN